MAEPTVELVQRAIQNMRTSADVAYFFDRLKSPAWIQPLVEVGMFAAPPEPRRLGDYVQLEPWPQSRYLARMAPEAPDEVARVIMSLPETDNGRVLVDLADALIGMPPEKAISLVDTAIRWLERPYLLLVPDRLSKLVVRLAESSQVEGALNLTAALLRLEPGRARTLEGVELDIPTPARALIDDYEYGRIVAEVLPALISAGAIRTVDLLCELLASAIHLSRFSESEETDFSYLWRKTIESSDQNLSHEPRDTLVEAVRDGSLALVTAHPDLIEPLTSRLDNRTAVFRRIALHVLRQAAPATSSLVAQRLLDSELLYGIDCYHEYWLLLHDRFHDLTLDDRAALFERIAVGPTFYREGEFSDAERTLRIEVWQWRVLAAIKEELPPEWADRYRVLTAERGEPEHPDLLSYTSSGWVGPTSPTSPDQLASMTSDQVVEYLRTWTPTGEWHGPTPEGLGRDLSAVVKASPGRFSAEAAKFRDLDPTYVRSLFWGLREAVAERFAISWEPVLELANWVLQQPRELPDREHGIGDVDPGWSWARKSIADLLGVGLKDGTSEVPFELRASAWSVLEILAEDEDPTPESEERFGGSNMDPATLAINTVRGQAIESVIEYALWIYRHLEKGDSGSAAGFAAMPEASTVLARHLDVEVDPSLAIRSVYGRRFPWLLLIDSEWTRSRLAQIFPAETSLLPYWDAAWDAYIAFCPPFNEPFDVLRNDYRRAVDRLPEHPGAQHRPHGVPARLAEHLMTMYRRARLDFEPGGLLDAFYVSAEDELRAWAMASLGRSLQVLDSSGGAPTPVPLEPSDSARLMDLWTTRLDTARAAIDRTKYRKELSEFGWWFTSQAFDVEWSLRQLVAVLRITGRVEASHLVLRQLSTTALSHPSLSIDALRLMIQGDTEGWTVVVWDDELADILRAGIVSSDAVARGATIDVIHQLGARGLRQYRDLLPSDSSS